MNLIQLPTTDLCLSYSNESSIWFLGLGFALGVVFPALWKHSRKTIVSILKLIIIIPVGLIISYVLLAIPYGIFTFSFIIFLEFCLFLVLFFNVFNTEYRSRWWTGSVNAAQKILKCRGYEDSEYLLFSVPIFSWMRSIIG